MDPFVTHFRVVARFQSARSPRVSVPSGGHVWALLDPAAHILLMAIILQAATRSPALGTSLAPFHAIGYIALQFCRALANYLNGAVRANRALLQMGTTSLVGFIVFGAVLATMRIGTNLHWPAVLEAATMAFLPDSIPVPYRDLVLIIPLVHVIMGFQKGFYPEYRAIGVGMASLYDIVFLTLFAGMPVFTFYRKILRNE